MTKKIIITGGAGFIGSHLVVNLVNQGNHVFCVDNLITGNLRNLDEVKENKNFTFIKHDVSKPLYLDGHIDQIYHLASCASPKDYIQYPIQTLKVGALGTHNMLGLAKDKKASFLLASTSEIYGDPLENPQTENYWGNVNPIGPRGVYDESKRFAEALTMAYHRYHDVPTHIARIFNTYGPKMRSNDGRVIPNFLLQALTGKELTVYGDGSQTRSFCYISDMLKALLKLMNSDIYEPVNMGNPAEMKIIEVAKLVKEKFNPQIDIIFNDLPVDDPKVRRPDISRAIELLDWQPDVKFEKGLELTYKYFKNNFST